MLNHLYQKKNETVDEAKPLKIAKAFDSFDATIKLAAMTNQTAEFDQYISDTKKMQAYKGAITGPLASQAASTDSRNSPISKSTLATTPTEMPYIAPALSRPDNTGTETRTTSFSPAQGSSVNNTVVHLAVVLTLAILALALAIYLLVR